jgi:transposase
MQKALTFMNLQLHHVVADVTGVTGMKIIRAIVNGQRDPQVLAQMRDVRCKASLETVRAALVGNYQPEHVFALTQALALYDFYQARVDECDAQIEAVLAVLTAKKASPRAPLPKARHRTVQPNAVSFDVRPVLYQLAGVDLTQIHGIGPYLALRLIAECGTDLSRWRSAKHFTSWLTLSPGMQDQRWQGIVGAYPKDDQPRGCAPSTGRSHRGSNQHRTGRLLPSLVSAHRESQSRDGDRTQDRGSVLQRDALRH